MFGRRTATAAVVVAGMVLMVTSAAWAESKAEKMRTNFALAKLSLIDAIRITENQTGGKVYKAELKRKDNRVYYELEFVVGDETIKTQVDALIVPQEGNFRAAPAPAPMPTPPAVVRPQPVPPPAPARPAPTPRPQAPRPAPQPLEEDRPVQPIQPDTTPRPTPPAPQPSQPPQPTTTLPPAGIVIPFDTEGAGALPAGFAAAETGGAGKAATWRIATDDGAPSTPNVVVLADNSNGPSTFSLLVANQPVLADVDTSVKVNITGGTDGSSAGLIWRYQDANNYYVAAYNKAENTLDVWRVKDGKRKRIAAGAAEVEAGAAWHEIHVEMKGNRVTAYLDSKKVVSERDFTFAEPGRVGFWASGDTTAAFDDLTVAEATKG